MPIAPAATVLIAGTPTDPNVTVLAYLVNVLVDAIAAPLMKYVLLPTTREEGPARTTMYTATVTCTPTASETVEVTVVVVVTPVTIAVTDGEVVLELVCTAPTPAPDPALDRLELDDVELEVMLSVLELVLPAPTAAPPV